MLSVRWRTDWPSDRVWFGTAQTDDSPRATVPAIRPSGEFAPGIGKRLDGWPNSELNPGAIIALSPAVDAAAEAVFNSWGKGKDAPRFNVDSVNKPVVIPPAYGLAGVHRVTKRRSAMPCRRTTRSARSVSHLSKWQTWPSI